jgi:UDP-glucose 4-epimerase
LNIKKNDHILIIGIAGGLAQIATRLIVKNHPQAKIIGIDARNIDHLEEIPNTTFIRMKYSRNKFETLFREYKFAYVFHLGRMTHVQTGGSSDQEKRFKVHVVGTKIILDLCLQTKVKKIVLLSSFHVYGAMGDNPVFIDEDHALRASLNYPELRDLVEMDQLSTNWMWKNQSKIDMLVLRPCNIVGPQIRNAITRYLTSNYTPYPVDYKPMFQFIHEYDMANILVKSLGTLPTGVYNIAPDDFISLAEARKIIGTKGLPFSMYVTSIIAKLLKKRFPLIPDYLIEYLRFSCLISGKEAKKHLGPDTFRYSVRETLQLLKLD